LSISDLAEDELAVKKHWLKLITFLYNYIISHNKLILSLKVELKNELKIHLTTGADL
jgi:hypothetical protein